MNANSAEQGMFDNVITRINTLLGEISQARKEAEALAKAAKKATNKK